MITAHHKVDKAVALGIDTDPNAGKHGGGQWRSNGCSYINADSLAKASFPLRRELPGNPGLKNGTGINRSERKRTIPGNIKTAYFEQTKIIKDLTKIGSRLIFGLNPDPRWDKASACFERAPGSKIVHQGIMENR